MLSINKFYFERENFFRFWTKSILFLYNNIEIYRKLINYFVLYELNTSYTFLKFVYKFYINFVDSYLF
jgi:hypothetical protein